MAKRKKLNINIDQHPVGYKGNVSIKVMKKGQIIKTLNTSNSGTILLFNGIAKFLSGAFSKTNYNQDITSFLPRYLGVGEMINPSNTDPLMYSLQKEVDLGERIKLNVNNVKIDNNNKTVILPVTALVTYESIGDKLITELGLFSGGAPFTSNMLARIMVPDDNGGYGRTLTEGDSWLIEWNIVIQNN